MAKPLIDLDDDSLFATPSSGNGRRMGIAPQSAASTPASKINLDDDSLFYKDKQEASQDVVAARYRAMNGYDKPSQSEAPANQSTFDKIDNTITRVAGTNTPNPSEVNQAGRARVAEEEAARQAAIAARRKELGTDQERNYAMRAFDSAAGGAANFIGSTAEYLGRQFGIKGLEELGQKAQIDGAALTPQEQDLLQKVVGGIGSALPMMVGGVGTGVAAGVATGSRVIAGLAGSAAGAAMEAPSIAQEAYEGALKETGNEAVAERQGYKAAAYNLPLSFITNKLGLFGDAGGRAAQTFKTILFEGVQEGGQKVLTNVMGYQPTGKGVSEEALVGGLTGGVLKQFNYTPEQKPGDKKVDDKPAEQPGPTGQPVDTGGPAADAEAGLPNTANLPSRLGFNEIYETFNMSPAVAAVMYQDTGSVEERELITKAVDRAEIQEKFQDALNNPELLGNVRLQMQEYPEFSEVLKNSLPDFVNRMPPANIQKPLNPLMESMRDVRNDDGQQVPIADQIIQADQGTSFEELSDRLSILMPKDKMPVLEVTDTSVAFDMGENGILRVGLRSLPDLEGVTPIRTGRIGSLMLELLPKGTDLAASTVQPAPVVETDTQTAPVDEASVQTAPAVETPAQPAPTGKMAELALIQERFATTENEPVENFKLAKVPANFNKLAKAFGVQVVAYNYTGNNGSIRSKAGMALSRQDGKAMIAINMTRANQAGLFVFGHEVFHILEQRFPVQAAQLAQEVKQYLSQNAREAYAKFYENKGQAEKTDSEIAADVMGQMFTDRQFWRQVGEKNPSLLERVLDVIDSIIDRFRTNLDSNRMQIGKELAQYEKVRDMVASFVADTTGPINQGKPSQGKPDEGKPVQVSDMEEFSPSEKKPAAKPKEKAISGKEASEKLDKVLTLLREGKVSQAAKMFKDADLYAQGFGSFTELQRMAKETTAPRRDLERVEAQKTAPTPQRDVAPTEAEDVDQAGTSARRVGTRTEQAPEENDENMVPTPANLGLGEQFELRKGDQASLGLGRFIPPEELTPGQRLLREKIEQIVRGSAQMKFMNDTVLLLHGQIAEVEAKIKALGEITTEEDGKIITFRVRDDSDQNPGLWGTYDESTYDRMTKGFRPDKPTTKTALLDTLSNLKDELTTARQKSIAGKAKVYKLSIARMFDRIFSEVDKATLRGLTREKALAVANPYFKALTIPGGAGLEASTQATQTEEDVQMGLDLSQDDMFDGARVVMGLIADHTIQTRFFSKKLKREVSTSKLTNTRSLEDLIQRGLRDGDFRYMDVVNGFRTYNMSVPRSVMDVSGQIAMRSRLDQHLEQNQHSTAARMEWMTSMRRTLEIDNSLRDKFTQEELKYHDDLVEAMKPLMTRRKVTEDMRDAASAEDAFPNLLFNRYTLDELSKRADLNRVFGNVREAWFQDVAYALRRRPDLQAQIFGAIAEDKASFDAWVAQKKAQVARDAEVMGKSKAFAALRNMAMPDGTRQDARLNSTPDRRVEFREIQQGTEPDVAGMVIGAYRQLQRLAADNGVDFMQIASVESSMRPGQETMPENRGAQPVVVTMADGKQLTMSTRYGADLLNELAMNGLARATAYVDMMAARYGEKLYRSSETRTAGLEWTRASQTEVVEIPGNEASRYEQEYVRLANAELSEIPAIMDSIARLNSILSGNVDPDTGEVLTADEADEMAAAYIDDLEMRAQKSAEIPYVDSLGRKRMGGVYDTGSDAPVALRRGETGFDTTLEQRAEQERRTGPEAAGEIADESVDDLLTSGVEVEMDGGFDNMFDAMNEEGVEEDIDQDGTQAPEQEIAATTEANRSTTRVPDSLSGGEYRFRRGPFAGTLVPSMVAEHVARITSTWKGAPQITVLPNANHLPPELRERVEQSLGKNMGAKGLYVDGQVFLFSDHISDMADVEFTLFHETYGHHGLRAFLGTKFDQFLEQTYNLNKNVRDQADALMAEKPMGMLEAVDEVLSDMAATGSKDGIVKTFIGRMIAGMRQIGLNNVANYLSTLTDAELGFTLKMARQAAENGLPSHGAPDTVRLAQARLPYEVFAGRGGETTAYARYNPITGTWAVFTATGQNIRGGWNTAIERDFNNVIAAMRKHGQVVMRARSGMYIDFKLGSDFQKYVDNRVPEDLRKIDFSRPLSMDNARAIVNMGRHLKRTAIINMQNEFLPVFQAVADLRAKGRISAAMDLVPDLEGNYERRTGEELAEARKQFEKPLLALKKEAFEKGASGTISSLGLPQDVVDRIGPDVNIVDAYLTAMHAEERNKHIAKINPKMPDGGSGMFTKDAVRILSAISSQPYAQKLNEMSIILADMSAYKLKRTYESGMMNKAEGNARANYKHYVTLSGLPDADNRFDDSGIGGVGSKFNSKKDKRALGRESVAEDIVARTIVSFERAIVTSNKNMVKQKLLAMLEYNYDPDFAVINRIQYNRRFDPDTQQVVEELDSNYLGRKDVMIVHVDGRPTAIQFKQTGKGTFAEAIHGSIAPPELGPWPLEMMGKFNQVIGQMLTTWNPAWTAINFTRDTQSLYFNAVSDRRVSKKMARRMVKYVPYAISAAFHVATDGKRAQGADPTMIAYYQEMRRAGGATSFLNLRGLDQKIEELEKMLDPKDPNVFVKGVTKMVEVAESINIPMEMAPRIAAYRVMREAGFSAQEAATFAGEITVNFNMRGASKWLRQWFLFFNPAVQGSAKMIKLAVDNPKTVAKLAGGMFVVGFLANILARALGGEDDDGINKLDKIPVFKRATSLVLWPDMPLTAIPIPYGWNAFFAAGTFTADTMWAGTMSAGTSAKRIAQAAFESFSPIGSAGLDSQTKTGTFFKAISPTALLPIVEIALNENRFGAPIVKTPSLFGAGSRANSALAFDSASPISAGTFKFLNELTGGDRVNSGMVDVNPGIVDYLIGSYVPGIGAEVYKFASWATKSALGYDTKSAAIPLVDRLSAKVPESWDFGAFRRAEGYVKTKFDDFKFNEQNREKILKEHPNLGQAVGIVNAANNQITDLRAARNQLEQRKDMTYGERVQMYNLARAKEKEIIQLSVRMLMASNPEMKKEILAGD